MVAAMAGIATNLPIFNSSDVLLSYLPLAHIFERVAEFAFIGVGGSIGYYSGVRVSPFRSFHCHVFCSLAPAAPTSLPLPLPLSLSSPQDVRKLLEDVAELKPTIFVGVPRVFDRIYDRIWAGVKEVLWPWKLAFLVLAITACWDWCK